MLEQKAPAPAGRWIQTLWLDAALFLGLPFLTFAVLAATSGLCTPVELFVVAYGVWSLGHHLPGFLKAYGDKAVFTSNRRVLLGAPPAIFLAALVANYLDSYAFVSLIALWALWHAFMQANGLLRLYDSRVGAHAPANAWMDRLYAASLYASASFLWRDEALYGLLSSLGRSGVPPVSPEVLAAASRASGVVLGVVCIAYIAFHVWLWRTQRPFSSVKLVYAGSMLLFFFGLYAGGVASPFVGLLALEIHHDVQYFAVAYQANRQAVRAHRGQGRVMELLFRGGGARVLLYLGAIVAYGAFSHTKDVLTPDTHRHLYFLFSAFMVTSSVMHYYTDGFIWRRPAPARPRGAGAGPLTSLWLGLLHGGPRVWQAVAATGIVTFFAITGATVPAANALEDARRLADAVPGSLSGQVKLGEALRKQGRGSEARAAFVRALAIDPDSAPAHVGLGRILLGSRSLVGADRHFRQAVSLNPGLAPQIQRLRQSMLQGLPDAQNSDD